MVHNKPLRGSSANCAFAVLGLPHPLEFVIRDSVPADYTIKGRWIGSPQQRGCAIMQPRLAYPKPFGGLSPSVALIVKCDSIPDLVIRKNLLASSHFRYICN